jgi:GT2 family glycosyltransferase
LKNPIKHKLAVIIVNYNVEHFLEQCLNSVKTALKNVNGEVFIVDNNSIDSSVEMIRSKFNDYKVLENKSNLGFSKANNQAIAESASEYILLLNPDTVVEEDTFKKVIDFMDGHPDAGGLGVRMVDGKGRFLPESKRGLPTPAVAFHKIFGLSTLFPSSQRFSKYYTGHLSQYKTHEIEILSGAFMMLRRSVLEKVGMLDESFFMYGEDIDLSYRIVKEGFKNYYFPETTIIHYKGESTKKTSVNYVFVFYNAMIIFARKHFSQQNAQLFSFFIHLAIYFRASLAILTRFIKKTILPIVDVVILLTGLFAMTLQWKKIHIDFPRYVLYVSIPAYLIVWFIGISFNGGYDRPLKFKKVLKGVILSTLLILVIYGLLPKYWQFSRLFILTGAIWILTYFLISRFFLHLAIGKSFNLFPVQNKRFAIIGDHEEIYRVSDIICQNGASKDLIFKVSASNERFDDCIGTISQLDQIVQHYDIHELIFCAKNIPAGEIIEWMTRIPSDDLDFKIAQPDSLSLIGSNSIETAGEHYVMNLNSLNVRENARKKRLLDLFLSTSLLILSPILLWFFVNKRKFIQNVLSILVNKYSLVGYNKVAFSDPTILPNLKPGILSPSDEIRTSDFELNDKLNLIYARDYSIFKDLIILSKAWRKLDR